MDRHGQNYCAHSIQAQIQIPDIDLFIERVGCNYINPQPFTGAKQTKGTS